MSIISNFARMSLAAAALAALGSHPVRAQDDATEVRHVSYAGLDLATSEGRAILDRRIAGAVRAVCGRADSLTLFEMSAVRACRREAFSRTEPQRARALAAASTRSNQVAIAAPR